MDLTDKEYKSIGLGTVTPDDYTGKVGLIGNRAGNFAIQNADLVLCLGSRMCKSITGYKRELFAREAKIVYLDIDESEFIDEKKLDILRSRSGRAAFFGGR